MTTQADNQPWQRKERRKPFKVGEEAVVPHIRGHISRWKSYGVITGIAPPYAIVNISYGSHKGKWQGLITELSRRARYLPERRAINP